MCVFVVSSFLEKIWINARYTLILLKLIYEWEVRFFNDPDCIYRFCIWTETGLRRLSWSLSNELWNPFIQLKLSEIYFNIPKQDLWKSTRLFC